MNGMKNDLKISMKKLSLEVNISSIELQENGSPVPSAEVSPVFSKRNVQFFILYGIANAFRAAFALSVGPFYPSEAEDRGVSATEIGFIFAVHDFTSFLMSFLYGTIIIKSIGPQRLLHFCVFGIGVSYIGFGCLTFFDDRMLFTTFSLILRIVMGALDGGIYPSLFTIYALEIPNSLSTGVSLLEMFYGIGSISGPLVIGFIIEKLGFTTVFAALGAFTILSSFLCVFLCPKVDWKNEEITTKVPRRSKELLEILAIPNVLLALLGLITASASIGFIGATLELHYSTLSTSMTGLLFASGSIMYTILCPVWGHVADKGYLSKNVICALGAALIIIAFSILGPLPFLPFETENWEGFVGYGIHGTGIGASLMTAYDHALDAVLVSGFPDNIATYSLVSGIYTGTFTLGNSVGPAISGVLYDLVGFRWGTMFIIGLGLIVILASTFSELRKRNKRPY